MVIDIIYDTAEEFRARALCERLALPERGVRGLQLRPISMRADCLSAFEFILERKPRPDLTITFLTGRLEKPKVRGALLRKHRWVAHGLIVSATSWPDAVKNDATRRLFFASVASDVDHSRFIPPAGHIHIGGNIVPSGNGMQVVYYSKELDTLAEMIKDFDKLKETNAAA